MFVTQANFDGIEYSLPNLSDYGSALQSFIDKMEEKHLRKLLGNELYEAFVEGLEETYPLQKWTDLRDGKSFEYMGESLLWVGMEDMLTPLIYSELLEKTYRKNTGVTAAVSKVENAEAITNNHDIVRGWNDYTKTTYFLRFFLEANEEDYPDLKWCQPEYRNILGI